MRPHRLAVGIAVLMVAIVMVTGCASPSGADYRALLTACPATGTKPLTLVIGARANSPEPGIGAEVQNLIFDAAVGSQEIQVVRLDGLPATVLTAKFSTDGQNSQIRQLDLERFVGQVEAAISNVRPSVPQADVLGALSLAGEETPAGGTVVLMDSGIPTIGPLSYTNDNMFDALSNDVTKFLGSQDLLPNLTGKSVVLVNVGFTADPQPSLPQNLRDQVVNLWKSVAQRAGATCVSDLTASPQRKSVATSVPVSVVPLPKPPAFSDCGTTILRDSGSVGFIAGTAKFRDPSTAQLVLQSLATILHNHAQRVILTGSTSSEGAEASNLDLSEARAAAVKMILVQLGVSASRITAIGVGSSGHNHVPDTTPSGALIPVAAAQNRSVAVTLMCR